MLGLRFAAFAGITGLDVIDLPIPQPRDNEVLVRVRAASVNPSDVKNLEGKMEGTTLPRTPGRDFAGTVVAGPPALINSDVWGTGGDVGFTRDGSHADYLLLPADGVSPKPTRLSFEEAASVGVNYLAAWLGLVDAAALAPGETVLVTGANGGVGSAVGQVAKWRGGKTIGVGRGAMSPDRQALFGIDTHVVADLNGLGQMARTVRDLTEGHGAEVAYDTVGGAWFEPCLQSLRPLGRQISIASVGTRRVSFDLLDFYHHRLRLFGVDTRAYDTSASARILERLAPGFESGALKAMPVAHRFGLNQAREAYALAGSSGAGGKIVFVFP